MKLCICELFLRFTSSLGTGGLGLRVTHNVGKYLETYLEHIVGFGLFMGFVEKYSNIEI